MVTCSLPVTDSVFVKRSVHILASRCVIGLTGASIGSVRSLYYNSAYARYDDVEEEDGSTKGGEDLVSSTAVGWFGSR